MIYTVTNQKGGTGKTTTALALAAGLFRKGKRVLAIDLDAQGNMSYTMQAKPGSGTALGVLLGELQAVDAVQQLGSGPDIIPASKIFSSADALITETGKEYRLKEALEPLRASYDYIVIDTPPAVGILTINALTAADAVIIPAQADIYSIQGVQQLAATIAPVRKYTNPGLKIAGILLTRYSARSILSRDAATLAGRVAASLNTKVFKTAIREGIAIKEAQISRQDIFTYAPKSKAASDYAAWIEEVLEAEK